MAFEQRDNTGALFANDQKGNENAPRYKGSCTIDGKKLFVSCWIKKSKAGKTYMSLSFEPPRDSGEAYKDASNGGESVPDDFEDDFLR